MRGFWASRCGKRSKELEALRIFMELQRPPYITISGADRGRWSADAQPATGAERLMCVRVSRAIAAARIPSTGGSSLGILPSGRIEHALPFYSEQQFGD